MQSTVREDLNHPMSLSGANVITRALYNFFVNPPLYYGYKFVKI